MRTLILLAGLWLPCLLWAVESQQARFQVEVVAQGLDHPWGLDFLADGRLLVSERSGQLRTVTVAPVAGNNTDNKAPATLSDPIQGLPDIWTGGQGGLLDVARYQDWIYFSYAEPGSLPLTNSTAVARAKLQANRLTDLQVVFRQQPKYVSRAHFGSRLVFDQAGHLYITLGDRYLPRDDAQTLDNHHGKIIRLWADGRVPEDNPFVATRGALPEIWSLGHRNSQGATLHPVTGELWTHEHGPRGGDEINLIQPGHNYGWPVITYGEEYSGGKIGEGTHKAGLEQPLHYWVPSIAPSGMTFYSGDAFPAWQGDLFVGSLKFRQLVRLELDGHKVVGEERLLEQEVGERIRDVVQGPDGFLYLLTDQSNGKILRLRP
ncbi:PQQ-dependent sugar dehydrogenase [Ketobacter sp.]|uniref:PQQ-dependent sugar dehydrogenase n=1 Tax=Ketobacter sp. TaxID=2083498 RepID=UPI000F129B4E|nr:PQQ-dependent sugar dehydrogenase [Ketobacter sp.]RLU00640.1 MAG: PQQ-dependent sugar dehydrogenase [Ketobacter sp.]